ncbi:MAG: alkaline phosphatase family protein [Thermoleophilaceae bacterium]
MTAAALVVVAPAAALPPIKHVFTIVLENKDQSQTFAANSPAPYLAKTLPSMGQFVPNYYGIGHESLDNYVAMVSGQPPNGVTQADSPAFVNMTPGTVGSDGVAVGQGSVFPTSVKTIADQLTSAGLTWRGYMEDMGNSFPSKPATCRHPAIGAPDSDQSAKAKDQYATRHNPFVYFHSIIDTPACDANDVPLTQLPGDLVSAVSTPNYVFITPDLCSDGHDDTCADGGPGGYKGIDGFLRKWVPQILGSPAYKEGGLLMVLFDEADTDDSACCNEQPGPNTPNPAGPRPGAGGGKTGAVLISPYIQPGTVNTTAYNHYSMLRSVEDVFGLPHLAFAAQDGLKPFGSDVFNAPAIPSTTGGGPGAPGGTTTRSSRIRIRVGGVPRRCVASRFSARVSVSASNGVRRVRAYVDRHSVRRSTHKRFRVRVKASSLRRGRHRLTVMAADRKGKRARRTVTFRRC